MKLSRGSNKKKARLEIIPLIDIMFFLVATFMMVSLSMIKNQGVDVNLPIASSSVSIERKQSATISVTATGDIFFNKKQVTLETLKPIVTEFRVENPTGPILLNCDKEAKMEVALSVLDNLRMLGITNVALQTIAPSNN